VGPCQGFYVLGPNRPARGVRTARALTFREVGSDDDDEDDDPFVDRATGRINFDAVRASITSAKPIRQKRPRDVVAGIRPKQKQASITSYFTGKAKMKKFKASSRARHPKLTPERRVKNITDREEGVAVQYLTLGGHRFYMRSEDSDDDNDDGMTVTRAASGLHAGAGQQTFGWDQSQRADLMLAFVDKTTGRSVLRYHNHHELGTHYTGHIPDCYRSTRSSSFLEFTASRRQDSFREGLARALTAVRPDRVKFVYTRTTTCELFHGADCHRLVPSTKPGSSKTFATALSACLTERSDTFVYLPAGERTRELDVEREVLPGIANGTLTGFVTVKGGSESRDVVEDFPVAGNFGFCIQRYAPRPDEISDFTKRQIADYLGLEGPDVARDVDRFIEKQLPRTINSGTFHTWETVTTSYLRWLINERGFTGFRVSHLMIYRFSDDPKHFLEPILQRRHDAKRAGNAVEAECLKLIGNGSFGYNGLEITNYNSVRLMRESTYRRERYKGLAHRNLKHTTMLSLIRTKIRPKKKKKRGKRRRAAASASDFFDTEARDDDDDDDDDEDEDEDEDDSDDVDDDRELLNVLGLEEEEEEAPAATIPLSSTSRPCTLWT